MSDAGGAADQLVSVVRRLARHLNRRISDVFAMLFHHKSAGSLGAVAGFAIAVVFAWKYLRPAPPARPKRRPPQPRPVNTEVQRDSDHFDVAQLDDTLPAGELTMSEIVRKKLSGCRKITCQMLGVILEEKNPEELQERATVRLATVDLLLEIAKYCDVYLMETILDDETERRVLLALEHAGLFHAGGLMKEKVLFCSTDIGRTSFARQLETDFHIDTNLDIISQLSRFIRCQLYVSSMEAGQIASNVYTSSSLEHYFS